MRPRPADASLQDLHEPVRCGKRECGPETDPVPGTRTRDQQQCDQDGGGRAAQVGERAHGPVEPGPAPLDDVEKDGLVGTIHPENQPHVTPPFGARRLPEYRDVAQRLDRATCNANVTPDTFAAVTVSLHFIDVMVTATPYR